MKKNPQKSKPLADAKVGQTTPPPRELWRYPFLILAIATTLSPVIWFYFTTNLSGVARMAEDRKIAVDLQDVSSVFTSHLTAIGLIVGLATALVVVLQAHFQRIEAKRSNEQREQEARRNESLGEVMEHTSNLIANMAGVMETTNRVLRTTHRLESKLESDTNRRRKAQADLQEVSAKFLENASIHKATFRKQVHVAYNQARFLAQDLPAKQYPPHYVVLYALYTGTVLGQSQEAHDILANWFDRADRRGVDLDDRLRARSRFFRGHFSVRVGNFTRAREYFQDGARIAPEPDAYTLFALMARLYELRDQATVTDEDRRAVEKEFEDFWQSKILTPVRSGKLEHKDFWEYLGHSYAALLAEGLDPADRLFTDPGQANPLKERVFKGLEVAKEANERYRQATNSDSGAFDAVRYEAGLTLARLGDPSRIMTLDELVKAVRRCRSQRNTGDLREKIVYTIRLARFCGRLAAEYTLHGMHDDARKAAADMEYWKQEALDLLAEFQAEWNPRERLFSVFANNYRDPASIIAAIETDVRVENYWDRRKAVAPTAGP